MEHISMSSTSTSASNSIGQNEFLFRTPISHAEELETPSFSQPMGHLSKEATEEIYRYLA